MLGLLGASIEFTQLFPHPIALPRKGQTLLGGVEQEPSVVEAHAHCRLRDLAVTLLGNHSFWYRRSSENKLLLGDNLDILREHVPGEGDSLV